jgi:hypothetical protein
MTSKGSYQEYSISIPVNRVVATDKENNTEVEVTELSFNLRKDASLGLLD